MVYNEQKSVNQNCVDVSDILPGKENASIKVRIVRMWKAPAFLNPSETNSLEMVLIDSKGGKIHASSKTQVTSCESCDIYDLGLSLVNIAEICAHTRDYEFLVDVIGVMTGMSAEREYIRDDKITKMIIIELTDHTGKCECALFGDYVDEVKRKVEKSTSVHECAVPPWHAPIFTSIWKSLAPSKVSGFMWQLLHGRVPTRNNLITRRILTVEEDVSCALCGEEKETELHLFLYCEIAGTQKLGME
ncbi:hypothetical protein P8452_76809 [Trifolium repens]|nr:hypothetical protein P8452_76809 [Trifolium repens]